MSSKYTVNRLLCLEKSLRSRLASLSSLSSESTRRTRYMREEGERIEEPTYDIKKVDQQMVKITKALFDIDMKIKEANAINKIDMDDTFDFDDLVKAID